jgi:hypothetical protein
MQTFRIFAVGPSGYTFLREGFLSQAQAIAVAEYVTRRVPSCMVSVDRETDGESVWSYSGRRPLPLTSTKRNSAAPSA